MQSSAIFYNIASNLYNNNKSRKEVRKENANQESLKSVGDLS